MKMFYVLIGILLSGSSLFATDATPDVSTAAVVPIRKVHVHFLNGNSDLREAILGQTEFAQKVYGATDMTQYKLRARLNLSTGETLVVSTDQEVYELRTPFSQAEAAKATIGGRLVCFDRQDFDADFGFFGLESKPFTTSIVGDTAHVAIRLMGPAIAFGIGAIDPMECAAAIQEDRAAKLKAITERPLKSGEGLTGFLQVIIPYTDFKQEEAGTAK